MSFAGPRGLQWIPLVGVYVIGSLINLLQGRKTYLGAIAFAVLAGFEFYTGHPETGLQLLTAAWTAMGLRSAIAKVSAPPTK